MASQPSLTIHAKVAHLPFSPIPFHGATANNGTMFSKCAGPIVVVLVASCACDERRSPTGPSDPSIAVTGHVTATNGGQPLAGLVVDFGAQTTGTDASGSFSLPRVGSASQRLLLTGSTIVPRSLVVSVRSTSDLAVDAISRTGFDLAFYRQFVRNGLESPDKTRDRIRTG